MAIQTRVIGFITDAAGGSATVSYDYDDVTLLLSLLRVVNTMIRSVQVKMMRNDGLLYGPFTVPTGTTTQAIPTADANRLLLALRPDGKLDGASISMW